MRFLHKFVTLSLSFCLALSFVFVCFHPVDAYADDNYTGSSAWQDWLTYWHSSLNVAVDDVSDGAFDADDLYKLRALQYAYGSMLYQQAATAMVTPDNFIPAGTIESGWYYRGGIAHTVTCFYYGQNSDPVNVSGGRVAFASADDFTIAVDYTPKPNISYPAFLTMNFYGYYYIASNSSLTFTGTNCTGIMSNYDFVDSQQCYVSRIATYDTIITMDETTLSSSYFVTSGYYSDRPARLIGGMLKNPNGQPISNTTQQFIRATVSNSFPDFVDALKEDLYSTYPSYIIDEIWIDPDTPIEPIYPTDFVTGIPRDWTIENPPLPTSPNVSLSPRDADFSIIDPSEAVAQNSSAFDFWWWLTDRILTYTDMKNIVVLFVGLGAVSYVLWRIGR